MYQKLNNKIVGRKRRIYKLSGENCSHLDFLDLSERFSYYTNVSIAILRKPEVSLTY